MEKINKKLNKIENKNQMKSILLPRFPNKLQH